MIASRGVSDARQLLGDLAVASLELVEGPRHERLRSVMSTFRHWYARTERWLQLVIEAGIAARAEPHAVTPELVALVAAPFARQSLAEEVDAVIARFDYIGYEEGWLYGGIEWERLCVPRSAFEVLRALFAPAHPERLAELDMTELDELLVRWGGELFEQLDVPAGIPNEHWWWFRPAP